MANAVREDVIAKVEQLGGTVCKSKTTVLHMGYFAMYEDTKHNTFTL